MTTNVVIYDQCYNSEESNLIAVNLALGEGLIIIISIVKLKVLLQVPLKVKVEVKVKV